nr:EOG090X0KOU [Macrothrix elegans]
MVPTTAERLREKNYACCECPLSSRMSSKKVFVTVGTTQFDNLVKQVLSPDTLSLFEEKGFTHLNIQVGCGLNPIIPAQTNIQISWYNLKESILPDIEDATLIISHAGAGTCLEALGAGKSLIVVINQDLMGNHQQELAEKLHSENHALMSHCWNLPHHLLDLAASRLLFLGKPNRDVLIKIIYNLLHVEQLN